MCSKDFLLGATSFSEILECNPPFVKEAVKCYIDEQCRFTDIFAKHQDIDLKHAISESRYKTQAEVEGYWKDNFHNENAYKLALSAKGKINSLEEKEQLFAKLQEIILREEKISDSHRLPVPEVKSCISSHKILECLTFLQSRALSETGHRLCLVM